ncbi:hypothetical protein BSKO_04081 [Bryopsis sp. KO-2023]|nr:hypothetical protein BSKO_04081 [Bryopsis sp. KO-2023]
MDFVVAARAGCQEVENLQESLRDAEIAYQLQLREALEDSCRVPHRSGGSRRGRQRAAVQFAEPEAENNPSWSSLLYAAQLQFHENLRLFDVHADKEVANRAFCEANQVASQIQHDKRFAKYVEDIPEDKWEREGDWIHEPWDGQVAEAPVTLTFAGYCHGNQNVGPAGCAGALVTFDGSTLWEGRKALGLRTAMQARFDGLLFGLEEAHALGLTNLTVAGLGDAMLQHLENFNIDAQQVPFALAPIIGRLSDLSSTFQKCEFGYDESHNQDRVQRLARSSAGLPGGSGAAPARRTVDRGSARTASPAGFAPPSGSAQAGRGRRIAQQQQGFRADGKSPMHPVEHQHRPGTKQRRPRPVEQWPPMQDEVEPSLSAGLSGAHLIECKICLEKVDEDSTYGIKSCSHAFCMACLEQHVKHSVSSRKFPVVCPWPECTKNMLDTECINLLDSEDMTRKFLEMKTELSIPEKDRLYCPNPRCSTLLIVEEVNRNFPVDCPGCSNLICVRCKAMWHHGLTCNQYKRLPHEMRVPEDKSLFTLAKRKQWRQCKKCQRMIELSLGCHHITCFCGHEFCYVCGAKWSLKRDERGAPAGPACGCDMFSTADVEEQGIVALPQPRPQANVQQPCRHWQRGNCRFGDRCRFRHE